MRAPREQCHDGVVELTGDRAEGAARTVLTVHGELDVATVAVLRAEVEAAMASPPPPVLVLDLSSTGFIDSRGCRELARAAKAGRTAGTDVLLVVPPANRAVRKIVDFMQFGALLPVHDALPPA